jgi:nucleoside-diphosphate-sugar epimerase
VNKDFLINREELILVTGASGFIGSRLVEHLVQSGFTNIRCLVRLSSDSSRVKALKALSQDKIRVEVTAGNLLSRADCTAATKDAAVIFHLAAARGEKSFPDAFMNSVVTTRNLMDAAIQQNCLRRIVSVSSFSVYTNQDKPHGILLDESCPVELHPELRSDPYCFAKVKQDEIVQEYGLKFGLPYVIVRPGFVYGPGNQGISGRVGIGTFGLFLHLGGSNAIPFTYVDNCAEAIALAGLKKGIEHEVINIVDDDLPSSRQFMRWYKKKVRHFPSVFVPHILSYALCTAWESYSKWSNGQLAPSFNRRMWHAYWKKTRYTNNKSKKLLGWTQTISTAAGLEHYFEACRNGGPKRA